MALRNTKEGRRGGAACRWRRFAQRQLRHSPVPLEDAGLHGTTRGWGKILILPPGYSDTIPQAIRRSGRRHRQLRAAGRTSQPRDADVAKSVAYGKRVKVYPLWQAASPPTAMFTDAAVVLFDSTIRYDASLPRSTARQSEPWLPRDRAMIDPLRRSESRRASPSIPTPGPRRRSTPEPARPRPGSKPTRRRSSRVLPGRPVDTGAAGTAAAAEGLQRPR